MADAPSVAVKSKIRAYDGFFKINKVTFVARRVDGTMGREQTHEVFERGDAAAALIYDIDANRVILVEQVRIPTFEKGRNGGWMLETMAGMIRTNETPEQTVVRETKEETGYQIAAPELIATFFSSPGGTSERIFLYYVAVRSADKVARGGGNRRENEDIRIVEMAPDELFARLTRGEIEDPKLVIAAHHLKDRLRYRPAAQAVLPPSTIRYRHKPSGCMVGIKTGPILSVTDVDVWVNSENTDMMMDRIIGKSISANIRYGGAVKNDQGDLVEDSIAVALRRKLGRRNYVRLNTVLETEPGELIEKGVRRILHVASVEGKEPGKGVIANPSAIGASVSAVLTYFQRRNEGFRLLTRRDRSILLPMMGAGDGGLSIETVARLIVGAVAAYLNTNKGFAGEIYMLAFTQRDLDQIQAAIGPMSEFEPA